MRLNDGWIVPSVVVVDVFRKRQTATITGISSVEDQPLAHRERTQDELDVFLERDLPVITGTDKERDLLLFLADRLIDLILIRQEKHFRRAGILKVRDLFDDRFLVFRSENRFGHDDQHRRQTIIIGKVSCESHSIIRIRDDREALPAQDTDRLPEVVIYVFFFVCDDLSVTQTDDP